MSSSSQIPTLMRSRKTQKHPEAVKEEKLFSLTQRGRYEPRRTVGRMDGTDLWRSHVSLASWHWLEMISVLSEGPALQLFAAARQARAELRRCGWWTMGKVSHAGSPGLHLQTVSGGGGLAVFNQRFAGDRPLRASTRWNLKLSWPFLPV